jgi:hypothetical protein
MAVITNESLVLRGVNVACDVVTGLERFGFNPANGGNSAVVLSYQRHLSTRASQAGSDPRPRHERIALGGASHAARRAGRPGSPAGVPERRHPARSAGRAILSRWSLAAGATAPRAAWCLDRLTIKRTAPAGQGTPLGHLQTSSRWAIAAGSLTSLSVGAGSSKRGDVVPVGMPARRMPTALTRGK